MILHRADIEPAQAAFDRDLERGRQVGGQAQVRGERFPVPAGRIAREASAPTSADTADIAA